MDKTARLSAIMIAINETKEKEEQALYGAELALKTRNYSHLQTCVVKLLAAETQTDALANEAKALQEDIEFESREIIL